MNLRGGSGEPEETWEVDIFLFFSTKEEKRTETEKKERRRKWKNNYFFIMPNPAKTMQHTRKININRKRMI